MINWLTTIVWLLPILFMIHDFEEIIMVTAWRRRNVKKLSSFKKQPFGKAQSTASLSGAVLEELILLSALSFISIYYDSYIVFFGVFVAYTIHLFLHITLSIFFRGYVPGILTAVLQIPLCVFFQGWVYVTIPITPIEAIVASFLSTAVLFVNILFLHGLMAKFDKWIHTYRNEEQLCSKQLY